MMGGVKQPDAGNSYQSNFGAGQVNQNQAYNQGQANQGYNQGQNQAYNQGQASPNSSQDQEDPTEKLIKMKKLLDAGVITEEEFAKMKSDLLGI